MLKKMAGEGQTITKSSKVDLSRLPLCHSSLVPHIKRVNYRVAQWKRSHIKKPDIPSPTDHRWELSEGVLEPLWSDGPVLPARVVDILDFDVNMEAENDSSDESDMGGPDSECDYSSDEDSDN